MNRVNWGAISYGIRMGLTALSLVFVVSVCHLQLASATVPAWALQDQDEDEDRESTVTVRGQLVLADPESGFEIKGMPVILDEFMSPPALPLPDNFAEMSLEDRQQWYADFIDSDKGKAYQAEVARLEEDRHYQETTADADGKFSFKNVVRSRFGLYGQREFTRDGKTYLAEFQAEFPVEEKVKFIELDRLPVVVKRILQPGEAAPDLVLKADANAKDRVHALEQYRGKHVLLYFWTIGSARHVQTELQKAHQADLDIQFLGINLNQPDEERDQYLAENPSDWTVLTTDGLDGAPVTTDYSVFQLPALWLIGPDGKIVATDIQFFQALSGENADLTATLKKALAGEAIVPATEGSIGDDNDG